MLGTIGLALSSVVRQLENFAGVMNFVIFPMFFLSSALYPLWRMQEVNSLIYQICLLNPFTYAVELIRFALYVDLNWVALAVVGCCGALFLFMALVAYDPSRGLMARTGGSQRKARAD